MRFTPAALVVALTATTSAILIPPEFFDFAADDVIHDTRLRDRPGHRGPPPFIQSLVEQKTTVVDLECPGCPYAGGYRQDAPEEILWQKHAENSIHLEFDTYNQSLNLNGHPLFPISNAQAASFFPLEAHQILPRPSGVSNTQNPPSIDLPLSYAIDVSEPIHPRQAPKSIFIIPIEVSILAINGIPVKTNTIALKLLHTPNPEFPYAIVKVEEIPFQETLGGDTCEGARSWMLCRFRAMAAERLRQTMDVWKEKAEDAGRRFRGRPGCKDKDAEMSAEEENEKPHYGSPFPWMRPHHHQGSEPDSDHEHPHGPPGHWRHHGGHHVHHRPHGLAHTLHKIVLFILIPALLGIVGGLTASALGMLVGQAIVFIWIRTIRRGQRGPLRARNGVVEVARDETAVEGEKDELLAEEVVKGLPVYQDAPGIDAAPVYEEAVRVDQKGRQ